MPTRVETFSAGRQPGAAADVRPGGRDFDGINRMIHNFQQGMLRIKYAARPVVAAAFARALGGGCEIVLQSHRVQASAELYMGLVELGVGLIPAAGGCKEFRCCASPTR